MHRQNKSRNNPKKMEQVVYAAPQAHPVSHQGEGPQVSSDSERPRRPWREEKMAMSYTIHNLKYKLERLEGLMDLREKGFKAEYKNKYEIIASHEATISNLKRDLQFQVAQVESLKHRSHQEKDEMAARLEAEKQKLSEQNNQMLQLDLDKQKSVLLQIDLQMKQLQELEQELQQKDDVILHLRKEKMGLSNKLTEATDQLTNSKAEFLQSDQAWQTRYEALQEKYSELEVKEQSWKTSVEQAEEQKKELEELSMKLKASKRETAECLLQNNKDWQAKYDALEERFRQQLEKELSREEKITQVEETTEEQEENQQILEVTVSQVDIENTEPEDICFSTEEETEVKEQSTTDKKMRKKEKKAMKKKQKQEMEDLKRKQQEEHKDLKGKQKLEKLQEKEMNKKEAQMKAELQKRAKEEKKERKRKEKERKNGGDKCDSDAKMERAAGCSIECQQ
ncbi:trichohyalin-like [Sparus aurata]|uniref:trichohyalin-like n=1 Tax=Sparus aurata TaxID=8175 RepID=UPI0011C15262|nr:trichohyalin-like [Sparus aurata]